MAFQRCAAECIGTFWLVLGGCGSAVLAAAFPDLGIGLLGVSLAFGLTVLTMAYAVGGIAVGSRERVVLLEIGEHWLVVGVAPGSVTGIATLPRGEISPAGTDAKPVTADFGALLAKLKAGRS